MERRQSRHDIGDVLLTLLPVVRNRREHNVRRQTAAVDRADALGRLPQVRAGIEHHAQMSELLLRPRRDQRIEIRARHRQKFLDACRHPQVRLLILGLKMMDVGDMDKPRRIRFDRIELPKLPVQTRNAAGKAVFPRARLGGRETDHEPPVAVAKRVH